MPITSNRIDNRPVGVFDSGLGGLTVIAALRRALPQEDIVYLGDTARVPYGNKSVDMIVRFARQDVDFLLNKGVKTVVAACNTVSAVALETIRKEHPGIPILGVIESGVAAAIQHGGDTITVLGTRATVNSDAYRKELHKQNASLLVESIACPLFVPFAEEGLTDLPSLQPIFDLYLSGLKKNPPDTLLLGCTHYPLFKGALSEYLPSSVRIIDSAEACAEHIRNFLQVNTMNANPNKKGNERYYITDFSGEFHKQAERFLGYSVKHLEKVVLD